MPANFNDTGSADLGYKEVSGAILFPKKQPTSKAHLPLDCSVAPLSLAPKIDYKSTTHLIWGNGSAQQVAATSVVRWEAAQIAEITRQQKL